MLLSSETDIRLVLKKLAPKITWLLSLTDRLSDSVTGVENSQQTYFHPAHHLRNSRGISAVFCLPNDTGASSFWNPQINRPVKGQ